MQRRLDDDPNRRYWASLPAQNGWVANWMWVEQRVGICVREDGLLAEVAGPELDTEPLRVHPGKNPEQCAAVLRSWFQRGWIALYRQPGMRFLSPVETEQALSDPAMWQTPELADVALCATEEGRNNLPV